MSEISKSYLQRKVIAMREGGVQHSVWLEGPLIMKGDEIMDVGQVFVTLANDEDATYQRYFKNRAEVETFIATLLKAAEKAWPPPQLVIGQQVRINKPGSREHGAHGRILQDDPPTGWVTIELARPRPPFRGYYRRTEIEKIGQGES